MVNVESHQLALRGIILGVMSEFSQDDVAGREGKQTLAESIKDALNIFLEDKEGFGGCSNAYQCQAACPKEIKVENIARMNREYLKEKSFK